MYEKKDLENYLRFGIRDSTWLLFDKINSIMEKFSLLKKTALLRRFDNFSLYNALCEIAEKNEVLCFSLLFDNNIFFYENNVENLSETILGFYDVPNYSNREKFNNEKIQVAKEIANFYYFSLIKIKMNELSELHPYVNGLDPNTDTYHYSSDPIDYFDLFKKSYKDVAFL